MRDGLRRWLDEDIFVKGKLTAHWVERRETLTPEQIEMLEIGYEMGWEDASDLAAQDAAEESL